MIFKQTRVNGGNSHDSLNVASFEVKVMEIPTSADPAVLWLRARQLCYLGGHAPQSGEIVGILKKLKDGMPTDLADSLKADEEDRKTDHAPLVQAKATIVTNRRRGEVEEKGRSRRRRRVRPVSPSFLCPTASFPHCGRCCSAEASLVTAVKTRHTLWCCVSRVP